MSSTKLREYQWRAASFIVSNIIDEVPQMAIVAPTGAGKSTIITSIILKLKSNIKGGIIAAPQEAIESGFYEDVEYYAPESYLAYKNSASDGFIGKKKKENLYKLLRLSKDKTVDMSIILRGIPHSNATEPRWALTTHQQMTIWGDSLWPSDLSGFALFIDEAHHAGETTKLFDLCSEWIKRGGQVIYVTATPYRADGNLIYPENIPTFIWSMSEHTINNFAPNNCLIKTVLVDAMASTISEYNGDTVGDSDLAEGIIRDKVQAWINDGRPKAVFILPGNNSIELSNILEKLLTDKGARVVNVVGANDEKKDSFRLALGVEKKAIKFSDSKVDAFIACNRFNEGTDWPLCSHVYNWGVPKSIGLIIQRWGRAFRSKDRYLDYPEKFKNTACITFFTLKAAKDSSLENKHFELSWLLATFMSDWKTGKKLENTIDFHFKNAINKIAKASFDSAENEDEYDSILKSEEELIQFVKDSDTTRIMAKAELAKRELMLTLDVESPTIEAIESYNKAMNIGDDALELPMLKIMVEELTRQEPEAIDCLNSKISATISKFPDKIIKTDLLDIFRSVLLEYKDKTISISEDIVSFQTAFTGQDSLEISTRLRELIEKPDLNIDLVKDIIQEYYDKNGKIPHRRVEGYIEFLPYKETWYCINAALRHGIRGVDQKTSIRKLSEELGLVSSKADLSIEDIKLAISEYTKENSVRPSSSSGDASMYFDDEESWAGINSALSSGGRGLGTSTSLRLLCKDMGLIQDLSRENTIDAITRYKQDNGKCPSSRSGDATKYFGFKTNWSFVSSAFEIGSVDGVEDGTNFIEFMVKNNLKDKKDEINLEIVKKAILKFHEETKTCPTKRSGDATEYFEFKTNWEVVDDRLRHKICGIEEKTSLSNICIELELKSAKQHLSIEIVKNAILKFHEETKTCPTEKSGDATKYFGFKITWTAVNQRLHNKLCGIKEETSLGNICIELELKSEKQQFSIEIVKNAILKFHSETKSCPTQKSGDATKYFGFKITWEALEKRLSSKLCGITEETSLRKICIELGLMAQKPQLSNEIIMIAIKKYYDENSCYPRGSSGDATKYFGFQETWSAVSGALYMGTRGLKAKQGLPSLQKNMES